MPTAEGIPQTLYDKVFQDHVVDQKLDGTILLYIGTAQIVSFYEEVFAKKLCRQTFGSRSHFSSMFYHDPMDFRDSINNLNSKLLRVLEMLDDKSEDQIALSQPQITYVLSET